MTRKIFCIIIMHIPIADVTQWQSVRFPSRIRGFDSRHLLQNKRTPWGAFLFWIGRWGENPVRRKESVSLCKPKHVGKLPLAAILGSDSRHLLLRVILSGVRPRSCSANASHCFAVRLRFTSLRMTRADAVETRRANSNAVRILQENKPVLWRAPFGVPFCFYF